MKNWNQIAQQTKRTWVVKMDDDTGCPLDWIAERSITRIERLGFKIIPGPDQTVETLIEAKMLTL